MNLEHLVVVQIRKCSEVMETFGKDTGRDWNVFSKTKAGIIQ
jgi:hypothetical protein